MNTINNICVELLEQLVPDIFGSAAMGFDANNIMHLIMLVLLMCSVIINICMWWALGCRAIRGLLDIGNYFIARSSYLNLSQYANRQHVLNVSVGGFLKVMAFMAACTMVMASIHANPINIRFFG